MPPKSPKIPRPSNAFILYRIDFQREVTSRPEPYDSKGSNRCNEISKEAGASWRLEPAEVQAKYYRLAEEAKRQHARLYPGYKYVPSK
ncbi:high mobility group box domain-containing protein, partial [Daedaleopsis nitida]